MGFSQLVFPSVGERKIGNVVGENQDFLQSRNVFHLEMSRMARKELGLEVGNSSQSFGIQDFSRMFCCFSLLCLELFFILRKSGNKCGFGVGKEGQ